MSKTISYIEVLKPGISSIQDSGRFGYLSQGIPLAGFMDSRSAGFANLLVGNEQDTACIEWSMLPPKLLFKDTAVIAITGVQVKVYVNGFEMETYKSIRVPKNGILSFGALESGVYGYIAISNGFQTKKVLGSRSWFPQITNQYLFLKEMLLPFFANGKILDSKSKMAHILVDDAEATLEVFAGPEYHLLSEQQRQLLFDQNYTLSPHRNRMGIQLKESLAKHSFEMLSSPVLPGTVQWTPSGNLIVLMKDAQTIGGYPRILQLTEKALTRLSNHTQKISFCLIM